MQAEEADVATAGRVAAAFAAGEPINVELLLCTKGETRMWGQISFTPVLSETDGTVENHVCPLFPLSLLLTLHLLRSRLSTKAEMSTCTWWKQPFPHAWLRFEELNICYRSG